MDGMRGQRGVRSPTVEKHERVGAVPLLIEIIVEAAGFLSRRFDKLQEQFADAMTMLGLGVYRADDVNLVLFTRRH
jgi:hypothetical protein